MNKILLATGALILAATAPASAQLLGGGGLGGSVGGGLGGGLGGGIGSTMGSVRGTADGALSGTASTSGSNRVDRRSGSVSANRSVDAAGSGTLGKTLSMPAGTVDGAGSGKASGSANASGNAQLIGTDGVRDTVASTRSTVGSTADSTRSTVSSTAGSARTAVADRAGIVAGQASGSANGALSATGNQLALAKSAAANASGAFAIEPGMTIQSAKGRTIGRVRQVVADSRGHVEALLVDVKGRAATLPAANFSGQGGILVSAMGESEIGKLAKQAQGSGSATADMR